MCLILLFLPQKEHRLNGCLEWRKTGDYKKQIAKGQGIFFKNQSIQSGWVCRQKRKTGRHSIELRRGFPLSYFFDMICRIKQFLFQKHLTIIGRRMSVILKEGIAKVATPSVFHVYPMRVNMTRSDLTFWFFWA